MPLPGRLPLRPPPALPGQCARQAGICRPHREPRAGEVRRARARRLSKVNKGGAPRAAGHARRSAPRRSLAWGLRLVCRGQCCSGAPVRAGRALSLRFHRARSRVVFLSVLPAGTQQRSQVANPGLILKSMFFSLQ